MAEEEKKNDANAAGAGTAEGGGNAQSSGDFKEYYDNMIQKDKERKQKDIDKQLDAIAGDRQALNEGESRRFGYFSIPYPATVGDQAYSQNHNYPKIIDGKVQLEKRGIYTNNPKTGKGHDALFPAPDFIDDADKAAFEEKLKKIDEMGAKEREEYLKKLKEKREQKELYHFKPAGPQIMFDFYKPINEGDNEKMLKFQIPETNGPLYKEPDKKRFILPGNKVATENRQIYSGITKEGPSFKPDDYFQFYLSDDQVQQRIIDGDKKEREDKLKKVDERKKNVPGRPAFKPAALKKCEPFSNIIETYGVFASDEEKKASVNKAVEDKKKGRPKYVKQLPKGSVNHTNPFSPPRLIYQGRDGLFNDDLYKIPPPSEKDQKPVMSVRERKAAEEASNKNKRVPFTYNKLMKSSTFAPPISSFMTNLRREFPSIKFH